MAETNVAIRAMRITDLGRIQQIERLCFPTPWSYQAFRRELVSNINAHYLAAECDELVIGYIGVWIILDEGHITNVAVHPHWRGQGVGSQLLEAVAVLARSKGARKMTLEVRVSNQAARRLYERHGYRAYGVRRHYYHDNNEDALIMWKDMKSDVQQRCSDVGDRNEL